MRCTLAERRTNEKKLIELIHVARYDAERMCEERDWCDECPAAKDGLRCKAGYVADRLIANGVTVTDKNVGSKWIPVTERLPTPKHQFDARNWYLVALSNGVVKELAYEFHEHSVFGYGWRETAYPVTHWMPLPTAPEDVK